MSMAVVAVWTPHWIFWASATLLTWTLEPALTSTPCWLWKYESVKSTTFLRSSVIDAWVRARS